MLSNRALPPKIYEGFDAYLHASRQALSKYYIYFHPRLIMPPSQCWWHNKATALACLSGRNLLVPTLLGEVVSSECQTSDDGDTHTKTHAKA